MSYDWENEKKRATLLVWAAAIVALLSFIAIALGKQVGCGSSSPAPEPAPATPTKPECGGLDFGGEKREVCEGSTEQKLFVCTADGLKLIQDCPGAPPPPPDRCDGVTTFADIGPLITRDCKSCHAGFADYATAKGKINDFLGRLRLPSTNPQSMPRGAQKSQGERLRYLAPFEDWQKDGLRKDCVDTGTGTGSEPTVLSFSDLEATIAADSRDVPQADRRSTRYLVAPNAEDPGLYRKAAEKGLNSLSFQRTIVRTHVVAPGIWRVNLRDLGLSGRDWEKLEGADVLDLESQTAAGATLKALFATRKPWLQVSSFLDAALRNSDVYYDLTRTPSTLSALLVKVGVNFVADLEDGLAKLIGVSDSPLAPHNRLISRHQASNGFGAFWLTHDTGALDDARKNLAQNPFPPEVGSARAFLAVAHEAIYFGPNGLQFYALFNGAGIRQNVAPTDVVQDYRRARVGQEPVIQAAISCYGCHSSGLLLREDEYRATIIGNRDFSRADQILADELYGTADVNTGLFSADNAPFVAALTELEIDPAGNDPVNAVVDSFVGRYDIAKVASTLILSEAEALACVESSPNAVQQCAPLTRGGSVTQAQFVLCAKDLKKDCGLYTDPIR